MRKLLVITISLVSLAVAGIAAVVPALAGGGSVCRASSPTGGFVTPNP